MDEKKAPANQLNIDVPEEIAGGVYSNFAIVGHSPSEFVLDFVQILPGLPKAVVRSRIIMTPQHAQRLLMALQENIAKFEANFDMIKLPDMGPQGFPPPFGGPAGFA
jgi:hypothetical protein